MIWTIQIDLDGPDRHHDRHPDRKSSHQDLSYLVLDTEGTKENYLVIN